MRLLITGASGLLGANLVLSAAEEHDVVAVSGRWALRLPLSQAIQTDLAAPGVPRRLLEDARPDAVVHTAALADVDRCEVDPAATSRLNAELPGLLAQAARSVGARFVHISTDAVFDGLRPPYREEDLPSPVSEYGRSKLSGERAVAVADPDALIVRTSIYGWNAQPKRSLAEWFLSQLEEGARCRGVTDAWFTPILVDDLATLILQALTMDITGTLNLAGSECVSKLDFGRALAREFRLDESLIEPTTLGELSLTAPRPRRPCLDTARAAAVLGRPLPSVADGLAHFRALREEGHVDRLKALLVQEA